MINQWRKYVAISVISATLLTGCTRSQNNASTASSEPAATTSTKSQVATTTSTVNNLTSSKIVVDKEFSARDLEVGYDESLAINITLNGSSIKTSSSTGITVKSNILTITKEGTYVISGTLKDGQIIVDADEKDKIQIVLNGVNITCSNNAPIYVKTADKVFITLAANSKNTLTDGSKYVQTDDTNVDGVIFSKADLTINGTGSLTITGNYKHGIASKDDLVITGGTYNITAVKDGLNGKDCIKIKEGTIKISVTDGNGMQSKNGDDTTKGYIYICGGKIDIIKSQEGIEGTVVLIEDGTINITSQDDGINAASGSSSDTNRSTDDSSLNNSAPADHSTNAIPPADNSTDSNSVKDNSATDDSANNNTTTDPINKTNSTANTSASTDTATDEKLKKGGPDGFGKGGGEMENNTNCYILIAGGSVNIDASGDGIDSNGSLYVSGGTVTVNGPTNGGNGALDYNGNAEVTGGTVLVAGASGMSEGFSESSTQYSLSYNFKVVNEAGSEVKLTDLDGNVVASYTPTKQFQSVVISTPDLKKDAKYTLTCGSQSEDITLSSIATSGGEQTMGGGGRDHGNFGMKGDPNGNPRPGSDNSTDNSNTSDSANTSGSNN